MKKKMIVIVMSLIFVVTFLFVRNSKTVGTINGEKITLEEIIQYSEKNENQVSQHFSKQHNITSFGADFWTTDYEGQKPIESLLDSALEDIVYHRSVLGLAKSLNVIEEVDFNDEVKEYEQSKNGLSLWQFLDAKDQQLTNEIKKALLIQNPPTEVQLQEAFDNVEDKYKRSDFLIEYIEIKTDDKSILENLISELSSDEVFTSLQDKLSQSSVSSMTVDSREIHKEDLYMMSVSELLINSEINVLVEGFEENQFFYIVNKEGGEQLTLDDAPRFGEVSYVNNLFEEQLQQLISEANIKLNNKAYKDLENYYRKR